MTSATVDEQRALLEKVVMGGDLKNLSAEERLEYYRQVCDSLGLNPLTKPFAYITLSGGLTLYATKDATEQLARLYGISLRLNDGQLLDDVYVVRATASTTDRAADATGAVPVGTLKGEAKANALMKAETKASRRAVLRLVGLGWLDESEVDSVPGAAPVSVDHTTGEIVRQPKVQEYQPPIEDGPAKGSIEALQAHLESLGWTWEMFEEQVLEKSWAEFEELGGAPATAWRRFQNFQQEEKADDHN